MSGNPKAYSYIRLSTPEQLKGDSVRRQLSATDKYVRENGFELAEIIKDEGVSAFHGKNAEFGELSYFLDKIADGTVDVGSYLIVESVDRLSRQNFMEAFGLFSRIVQSGVNIVTLIDKKVYRKSTDNSENYDLLYASIAMMRAHDESVTKSIRMKAAWENKRNIARSGKVTRHKIPGWLKYSEDGNTIELIKDRSDLVNKIFQLSRDEYGAYSIAKKLNDEKIPTWGRSKFWHESYIKKILSNRSVLGEYQPKRLVKNGNRSEKVIDGDAIVNYYPKVVEPALFNQAQRASSSRQSSGRGRKGIHLSNLFTGLAKCGSCGSGLRYIDKGARPKGGTYLRCSAAVLSKECSAYGTRYEIIEDMLLKWIEGVNFETAVNRGRWEKELERLQHERNVLQHEYEQNKIQIEKCIDLLMLAPSVSDELNGRLTTLKTRNNNIERDQRKIDIDINELGQTEIDNRADLIRKIKVGPEHDMNEYNSVRRRVSSELKKVIKEISFHIIPIEEPKKPHTSVYLREPEIVATIKFRSGSWQYIDNNEDFSMYGKGNPKFRLWQQIKSINEAE